MRPRARTIDNLFTEEAVIDALDRIDNGLTKATIAGHNLLNTATGIAHYALTAAIGNRATVFAYALIGTWVTAMEAVPNEWKELVALLTFPAGLAGVCIASYTGFGTTVAQYYRQTANHIQQHGKLDARFAEAIILGSENRSFTGYCQQQGLYLAARDYGQLEVFEKARREHSNIKIPHF